MKTFPLKSINFEEAKSKQFHLIDEICREFSGSEILTMGDLGVVQGINKPRTAEKVERVIARFFNVESCILVTGAGTGALRWGILSTLKANQCILVHKAPVYPTTSTTLEGLNLRIVEADFNNLEELKLILKSERLDGALIQYTRQKLDDCYDLEKVVNVIKESQDIPILTDDNYAVMKVDKIGVELGADLSAFSSFKLLGPEGVGILVGKKKYIDEVEKMNYSGGSKVQGWQAMEVLRGMVTAPILLAIQAEQNDLLINELNQGKIKGIKNAFLANAQSKVLLVEFDDEIAERVLIEAEIRGAAPNPVGAESKYEMVPMFYKVSGTFLKADPTLKKRMIRINPMRAGKETVIRILEESIMAVKPCL